VIEQDYIMRMISLLAAVIARLVAHRKKREFPQALQTIDQASRHLLGADLALVNGLTGEQLIALFGGDPDLAPSRLYALGVLLAEQAEVERDEGLTDAAEREEGKAAAVLLESLRLTGSPLVPDHEERIESLLVKVQARSPELQERILWYRQGRGLQR
jgi:hypothetical protein